MPDKRSIPTIRKEREALMAKLDSAAADYSCALAQARAAEKLRNEIAEELDFHALHAFDGG